MAANTRLYFLMILNMKTAIYLFFLLFAFRGLAAEKYYIRVDSKTSYAEVYDEYVRIKSERAMTAIYKSKKQACRHSSYMQVYYVLHHTDSAYISARIIQCFAGLNTSMRSL